MLPGMMQTGFFGQPAAAGSIAFVGGTLYQSATNSAFTFNTNSLTGGDVGVSTSIETGDLVLLAFGCGVSETQDHTLALTSDPGFSTLVARQENNNVGGNSRARLIVYSMFAAAPGAISGTTSTFANSFSNHALILLVFRGVHSSILDVAAGIALSGDSALPDPPSVTPVTAGSVILTLGLTAGQVTNQANFQTPGDTSNFFTTSRGSTHDVMIGAGLKRDWASGAFDPAAWTVASALSGVHESIAETLVLKPA